MKPSESKGRVSRVGWLVAGAIACGAVSFAQSPASLQITVVDPSGAVVVGARVSVQADDGGAVSAETNARGDALFAALALKRYTVQVESDGFEGYELRGLQIRSGENHREVRLAIAKHAESVQVERDARERATDMRGDAFATLLRPDQIAALPDDPDEMERALTEAAGPGAVIRVNGFRGGRLPPKDQIQTIRFRRSMFAADTHEAGMVFVDITTRPGLDDWRGTTSAAFRDAALNARQAFAPVKGDEQTQRYGVTMSGPLWRKRTSLSLSADGVDAFDATTIVAALPGGPFSDTIRRPTRALNATMRLEHALAASQVVRAEWQRNVSTRDGLGAGDFDLAERAYRQQSTERLLRIALAGPARGSLFSELRLQRRDAHTAFASATHAPAVVVMNAFDAGGAQVDGARRWRETDLSEDLDIARGIHAVRIGVLLADFRLDTDILRNGIGTFTFASLDAYRLGLPSTFVRNTGDPRVAASMQQAGAYIQDDVRLRKELTLHAGVRQEWQSPIGGLHLGPRGGLAWSPLKNGATTVRAGGGVFFDWLDTQSYEQMLQLDGVHQHIEATVHPGFPDPTRGGAVSTLPLGRVQMAATMVQPRVIESMVAVEQLFPNEVRLSATFVRRTGAHELRGTNINAPIEGGRRPDPLSGPVTEVQSTAGSRYAAGTVALTFAPARRRVFASASYTAAQFINESDGPLALPANSHDPAGERGPALTDARHRFSGLVSASLPMRLRVGASVRTQSALPYNITTGRDDNGDTVSNDRPSGIGRNSGRGRTQADVAARLGWSIGFGARPATGPGSGPQGRTRGEDGNPLAGLGAGLDLTKRYNVEISLQAFNLLNRTNAINIAGVQTSPFFGLPTSAALPRRLEIGVRMSF